MITVEKFKKLTGIHVTEKHNGKMSGMMSLSTSCSQNKYCKAYAKDPNKVCSKCYAQRQMKMYKNLDECLTRNYRLLSNKILEEDELPLINAAYFRFEAFGDIGNETQLINYMNICNKNKDTNFALWTKNPFIIERVLEEGYEKPINLNIILSSPYINVTASSEKYPFIDKVFTVYDKNKIREDNVPINCGSKSCLECRRCYLKNNDFFINEKLK